MIGPLLWLNNLLIRILNARFVVADDGVSGLVFGVNMGFSDED